MSETQPIPQVSVAARAGTLSSDMIAAWFRHPDVSHSALQRQCVEFLLTEHAALLSALREKVQEWRAIGSIRPTLIVAEAIVRSADELAALLPAEEP